jgi:chorismate synthase
MASNHFGKIFKITTWGESHGPAIGVVIDGCPAGLAIDEALIHEALARRAPGRNQYTTPRKESDQAQLYSGVFEGKTTGAPISIIIQNKDADSRQYEAIKSLLRPGHANFTYLKKYGVFDYRGGGRASARETACRVAAGAVAQALLSQFDMTVLAYIKSIGTVTGVVDHKTLDQKMVFENPIFCPDDKKATEMMSLIKATKAAGDSLGGVVEFVAKGLPAGLGDPVYAKLEATLASAMMSLPAAKGFEIGEGFASTTMLGSEHNDLLGLVDGKAQPLSNHAGGTLGGISTGQPLLGRVAFKPTSSIQHAQKTLTLDGEEAVFKLPPTARHDPCVAIRAVPVVEAMCALVLADALLLNRCVTVEK